jgi:nucleoid DNA-binding protein
MKTPKTSVDLLQLKKELKEKKKCVVNGFGTFSVVPIKKGNYIHPPSHTMKIKFKPSRLLVKNIHEI